MSSFDYDRAFCRNLGWFSQSEQKALSTKRVAIAGCGGVGGIHALTLARLGIAQFNLSDFDKFEIENFNRQVGATLSTLSQPKLDVIAAMVSDINSEADINSFPFGINKENASDFLKNADLYVDSLDFFAIEPRILIFELCAELGIPAITAAPLGMGSALLCFMPGKMTFEEYFGLKGRPELEQFLRFYIGLAPASLHSEYLIDPDRLDLQNKRGPSTIIGCTLSAGIAASYAVKVLLNRGELICAPDGLHFDAYMNRLTKTCIQGGHMGDEFMERLSIARRAFKL